MPVQDFSDLTLDPQVRGFLHTPESPNNNALALTHGAGGNAQAPLLIALAETFAANGFTVLRFTLPYRQARSYGPPNPATAARDRAGIHNAIAAIKNVQAAPPFAHFEGWETFTSAANPTEAASAACSAPKSPI